MVVTALAASYLTVSNSMAKRQGKAAERKQAFYIAEAGLSEAFAGMWIGKSGEVASLANPARFGDGLFWVEVEDLGEGYHKLDSTGMYGSGRATLGLVVREGQQSVASLGIFSEDALILGPGTKINRWDSDLGTYDTQWDAAGNWIGTGVPESVSVGSNQSITVEATALEPTEIQGAATPGEGSAVSTVGSPTITGALDPRALNAMLPAVALPAITVGGGITHAGATPYTIDPGEHGHSNITVNGGSQLIVNGPATILVGDFQLAGSAEVLFDTTLGPIHIYVTGELNLAAGSVFTMAEPDPTQLTIQVSGTTGATLAAQGDFYGTVYAPLAELAVKKDLTVYGAMIGKRLDFEAGSRLHFDHHLAVLDAANSLPKQWSWRIVDFAPIGSSNDPFQNLGVVKNTLDYPADAHKDQWLDLTYYDLGKVVQTYSGMESAFDWSQVFEVIDASRDGATTDLMTTGGQKALAGDNLMVL